MNGRSKRRKYPYLRLHELRSDYHAEYGRAVRAGIFVYRIFVRSISALYVVGAISNCGRMEYRDGCILRHRAKERGQRKSKENDKELCCRSCRHLCHSRRLSVSCKRYRGIDCRVNDEKEFRESVLSNIFSEFSKIYGIVIILLLTF